MTSFVEDLASQLERELGPCPASRRALLDWVDSQLERCSRLGAPGEAAMAMIYNGYVEWCALLLERDQPLDVRDEFGDDRENGKNRTLSVRPVRLRP